MADGEASGEPGQLREWLKHEKAKEQFAAEDIRAAVVLGSVVQAIYVLQVQVTLRFANWFGGSVGSGRFQSLSVWGGPWFQQV